MLLEEFEIIKAGFNPQATRMLSTLLRDKTPRTLAYGFTTERETFHVYLAEDGKVVRVIYDHDDLLIDVKTETDDLLMTECVPNKRMYPERCDFEFCQLLMARQVYLPFTVYEMIAQQRWYGKKLEDLNMAYKVSDFIVSRPVSSSDLDLGNLDAYNANELTKRLTSAIESHVTGYLRARQLRADPTADQWLENLAMIMEQLCMKYLDSAKLGRVLSQQLQALMVEAKALCESKIAELNAKQSA